MESMKDADVQDNTDIDKASTDAKEHEQTADVQRRKSALSKKLQKIKEQADKRGVIYISRIPPHMKPHKVRSLLEPFGAIGRLYLAPEDPGLRRQRKKKGSNSGKNFTEGWVEFEDKRRAKQAVLMLNGQPIGGKHRNAHHFDLWCLKYLPKFKWDHLTEQIRYDKAVREQKLVAELSAAKRERDFYLSRVDRAKAMTAIADRKKRKGAGGNVGDSGTQQDGGVPMLEAPPRKLEAAAMNGGNKADLSAKKRKMHDGDGDGGDRGESKKKAKLGLGMSGEGERGERGDYKRGEETGFLQHGAKVNSAKGKGERQNALPDDFLALIAPRKNKVK